MTPRAVVVGSGPNGLSAAITLAKAGCQVLVLEAAPTPGGGLRSVVNEEYGTIHDHCAAVHPLARVSPFFRSLNLEKHVPLITPPRAFAQALPEQRRGPGAGPGSRILRARDTFSGIAAHAMLPPSAPLALATGALLGGVGLAAGWPIVRGGSGRIADFLAGQLLEAGGEIRCNSPVFAASLPSEVISANLVLWDTDAALAHEAAGTHSKKPRKYGPGAAKADFVTTSPIPWLDASLSRAATVHLGGSWQEVSRAERRVQEGLLPEHPFMLLSQPTLFDPSRAPEGLHTVWAYAHVPAGSTSDPKELIIREISRWAPGFEETIVDVRTSTAEQMYQYNPNYVGGDIASGATRSWQLLSSGSRGNPWKLPRPGWFLCSGTTPPGPGVHGMSGFLAARLALAGIGRAGFLFGR